MLLPQSRRCFSSLISSSTFVAKTVTFPTSTTVSSSPTTAQTKQILDKARSGILPRIFIRSVFWQEDRHGEGHSKREQFLRKHGRRKNEIVWVQEKLRDAREGFKMLPGEFKLWKHEVRTKMKGDWPGYCEDGTFHKEFSFRGAESFKNWNVNSDRDWGEGFTKAELTVSKNNYALFQGYICTDLPKEGVVKRAGWANIKSQKKRRSFGRDDRFIWDMYTHFIARVRGDGRTYTICLHTDDYFDVTWHDIYHYHLITRGGPYWQFVKIPFSKFAFGFRGYLQDKQEPINRNNVSAVGFTLRDDIDGPFQLEIDYIGVMYDEAHNDTFQYELYRQDPTEF